MKNNVNHAEPPIISKKILKIKKEQRKLFIGRFLSNRMIVSGLIITLFFFMVSIFAPLLATHDPYITNVNNRLQGPSKEHILGTDHVGRDLFSRLVYGARASMGIGFSVCILGALIGMSIGLYASYYKSIDGLLMRISDGMMAFPGILLAVAIMAVLGPRVENIIIVLTFIYIPRYARVVRATALIVGKQLYIEAIRALGASSTRIIWFHILPNTLAPLIVQTTFVFAQAIIIEASLSFLGVGVPAPFPSWGSIINDSRAYLHLAWWTVGFGGITIILSVLGLNMFGDGLRDLLDPNIKKVTSVITQFK